MSLSIHQTSPTTWSVGRVTRERGQTLFERDPRFSPVLSLREAEVLLNMEMRELHFRIVKAREKFHAQ